MSTSRRDFLSKLGIGSLGALGAASLTRAVLAAEKDSPNKWEPVSDRKIKVGIAGYGVCRFGAAFGFQNHPNVEIVAVTDIQPQNCAGLMKAVKCDKSYPCLEEMVKDDAIEAIFVATDAPSHPQHCIAAMKHGKHVMSAVPACFGSIEEGEAMLETVEKTGLKYMMAETSYFHAELYAMRQLYRAGAFGKLNYSEGEYFHWCPTPIPSYKDWRIGVPPQWYPTHSNAYYVGVTGKSFTSVSCTGTRNPLVAKWFGPGNENRYKNPFSDEVALFETEEKAPCRMAVMWGTQGYHGEQGRVFGELGSYNYAYAGGKYVGSKKVDIDLARPALPPGVPAGGHGGSHGYLMNEFVTAILEDRAPLCDIYQALAMTVGGIVAHQSALKGGERLPIPQYKPKA